MGNFIIEMILKCRVLIDEKLFLATLVELPTLIEAQKTLDYRTFFKSCDVSQMLYVHNRVLD
jgi:TATA-binding protein-associated factor Taf7